MASPVPKVAGFREARMSLTFDNFLLVIHRLFRIMKGSWTSSYWTLDDQNFSGDSLTKTGADAFFIGPGCPLHHLPQRGFQDFAIVIFW